jgi:hypothetical protein
MKIAKCLANSQTGHKYESLASKNCTNQLTTKIVQIRVMILYNRLNYRIPHWIHRQSIRGIRLIRCAKPISDRFFGDR